MKPKKLSILLFGLLNGALLSSCNDNSVGSTSQVANKQIKGQQNVKYDNDKVDGVWAAVNGYDGAAINPTINMLSQNNTDSMMTFLGCEDVSGSEKATYNLKSFTDKPISYTKTIPSKFQEFADNYSGGYLIDSLDRQETLQQIKFDGGDYYGDNKKQCYFAISNQDNLKPLYVKLVLDTKKIATYDVTQGFNTWQSKPIEDLENLSASTKITMQKLVDPTYGLDNKAINLAVENVVLDEMIKDYFGKLYEHQKISLIKDYISLRIIGAEQNLKDIIELNTLLKKLYYVRNNPILSNEIMDHILNKFVSYNEEFPKIGKFLIDEFAMTEIFNKVATANIIYMIPEVRLNTSSSGVARAYEVAINGHPMTHIKYTEYSYNQATYEQNNLMIDSLSKRTQFVDGYLKDLAASNIDREVLASICLMPPGNSLASSNCTPLNDAISATEKSTFNKASSFEKLSIKGSDIKMPNFNNISKLEARISENAVKRTGGSTATKAMEEIGITKIAGAMGGPIGFIAEQLILDQVIGLAMHDVSSPKDD
ncbi:MAG: hypothetical protein PHC75_09445, partial [Burkholderiales bacterium]|nr:hypothetical protein [Burkholderiales bacterium]